MNPAPTVVLLHGLGVRNWAMVPLARALHRDGYRTVNLTYPSRSLPLEEVAADWLPAQLSSAHLSPSTPANFVTHSMGGLVVRLLRRLHPTDYPGRVVMIAPPNQGSEVVDRLKHLKFFCRILGLNGCRLGTDVGGLPQHLGPWAAAAGELGIIAGNRSLNPLCSSWIEGPNDGEVSVRRAQLEGMTDFVVLPHSHTMLLWSTATFTQVRAFLCGGHFYQVTPAAGGLG